MNQDVSCTHSWHTEDKIYSMRKTIFSYRQVIGMNIIGNGNMMKLTNPSNYVTKFRQKETKKRTTKKMYTTIINTLCLFLPLKRDQICQL